MWNMLQCAVQGRGHIRENIPCQDKTYVLSENDVCVIALADGAGSAKMSHYGAAYVTRYICDELAGGFERYFAEEDGVAIKRKLVDDLLTGLTRVATAQKCEVKDLASTLLAAAVKDGRYLLIHIGDGVIGYLRGEELKVASGPENGEFANTTTFVTSGDVLKTMEIKKGNLGSISGFALMSDGTGSSFYDKRDGSLASGLKKMMKLSRIMDRDCLEDEIIRSFETEVKNHTMDDCSLVFVVAEDASFQGYSSLKREEKERLLGYEKRRLSRKRLQRFDSILSYLRTPHALCSISRKIHLREKYTRKYMEILLSRHLIVQDHGKYKTAIIMSR